MATDELRGLVLEILAGLSSRNTTAIQDATDLIRDGVLDSLGFLTLATRVERRLGKELPFDDYAPEEFAVFGKFLEICRRASASP